MQPLPSRAAQPMKAHLSSGIISCCLSYWTILLIVIIIIIIIEVIKGIITIITIFNSASQNFIILSIQTSLFLMFFIISTKFLILCLPYPHMPESACTVQDYMYLSICFSERVNLFENGTIPNPTLITLKKQINLIFNLTLVHLKKIGTIY